MSTFLTKQEQNVAEKYLQFCESFGIPPMSQYKKLIAYGMKQIEPEAYPHSENREETIAIYKEQCRKFGIPFCQRLNEKSTSRIWDYILRDANIEVNKEFNEELAKIKDIILRGKIKVALQVLYDERIYVKKEQTTALFACENDNKEIQKEYENLGGKERLLALSEISSYIFDEEDEEEEVNENEEDF